MIKALLLNLDRSPDRLEAIAAQFKTIGVHFERMSAVDGKVATEEEFQKFVSLRQRDGNLWNRGRMGCFLSHYNAWIAAANSADPYTAVFEDDMHLSPGLKEFLATDAWIPRECEIVRLEPSTNRVWLDPEILAAREGRRLRKVKSTTWCAGGYIISRDAARKLVALPESVHGSVDSFLFCFEESAIARSLHLSQIVPALCIQDKFHHADIKDIRFFSGIDDIDDEITWRRRVKGLTLKSPLTYLVKTIRGYERIPYAA